MGKVSKYRAIKTNGYASKREAARAEELKILERAGRITGLREQVVYVLAPSVVIQGRKRPPVRYIADFVYWEIDPKRKDQFPNGKWVTEDVKGVKTAVYVMKRHLMKSVHGIDILET